MLPETTTTDWRRTPWSYVVPLYVSTKNPESWYESQLHSPSLSVQDLSTFLHCCISVLIIQSFSKIIWILCDFHLLFRFHQLVLHLILTAASIGKFINSDPETFRFCRYLFEIPLILTMLWNPSDKLLKCFWLLDANLVLSLIQPTSSILSVFQTSTCLPAYQPLNG